MFLWFGFLCVWSSCKSVKNARFFSPVWGAFGGRFLLDYLGLEGIGVFVFLVFVCFFVLICSCFVFVLLLDCFWCCSCSRFFGVCSVLVFWLSFC